MSIRQAGIYASGPYRPAIYGRSTGLPIEQLLPILVSAAFAPTAAAVTDLPAGLEVSAAIPDPVAVLSVWAPDIDATVAIPVTITTTTALPGLVAVTAE